MRQREKVTVGGPIVGCDAVGRVTAKKFRVTDVVTVEAPGTVTATDVTPSGASPNRTLSNPSALAAPATTCAVVKQWSCGPELVVDTGSAYTQSASSMPPGVAGDA